MHCENYLEDTDGRGRGPAPNAYSLRPTVGMPDVTDPTLWQSVAYSLRPLIDVPGAVAAGPGPAYNVTGTTRHGCQTDGARMTFGRLTHTKDPVRSPGPAAYLPCFRHLTNTSGPKYLFPLKTRRRCGPSAAESVVPSSSDRAASPEHVHRVPPSRQKGFTIKRRPEYATRATGPGPAGYGPTAVDTYRRRGPATTFGARLPGRERSAAAAAAVGPATYDPSYGCAAGCRTKFTFGARHSPESMPYAVPADNAPPPAERCSRV